MEQRCHGRIAAEPVLGEVEGCPHLIGRAKFNTGGSSLRLVAGCPGSADKTCNRYQAQSAASKPTRDLSLRHLRLRLIWFGNSWMPKDVPSAQTIKGSRARRDAPPVVGGENQSSVLMGAIMCDSQGLTLQDILSNESPPGRALGGESEETAQSCANASYPSSSRWREFVNFIQFYFLYSRMSPG
jgi:hypothetical protein